LPFALTVGNHAKCYGVNKVGVRRRGYSKETIAALHHAYHLLLSAKLNTSQALERIRAEIQDVPEVDEVVSFVESSQRGVVK
jgi:UDP-N-acetylglucosamine acyltransferase